MTPPQESTAGLEPRIARIEGDMQEVRQSLTRLEGALIGLDGKGGLLRKVESTDADVETLMADYHARKGLQQLIAPFWAIVGGVVVVLADKFVLAYF